MKPIILFFILGIYLLIIFSLSSASALTISSVSTSPSEVEPGKTVDITIRIENDGNEDIEDVSVSLIFKELFRDALGNVVSVNEVPFAPFDSSSEVSFDEILEDKSKEAEFEIIALNDAKSGIHKIPLQITYIENNQLKTKSSIISITVSSKPLIGVSLEDSLLLKGQENELSIKIVNKGLSDIKFSEIEIGSSTYFNVLSAKNIYIGDIDSDDFDTAEFRVYFKENVPGIVNVPVSVAYKDALNKKYTEDYNLQVNVYSRDKAIELGLLEKSNTTYYVTGIAVAIVLWIIYRRLKKRRKMKRVEEM